MGDVFSCYFYEKLQKKNVICTQVVAPKGSIHFFFLAQSPLLELLRDVGGIQGSVKGGSAKAHMTLFGDKRHQRSVHIDQPSGCHVSRNL